MQQVAAHLLHHSDDAVAVVAAAADTDTDDDDDYNCDDNDANRPL